jgi:hypothetical protein
MACSSLIHSPTHCIGIYVVSMHNVRRSSPLGLLHKRGDKLIECGSTLTLSLGRRTDITIPRCSTSKSMTSHRRLIPSTFNLGQPPYSFRATERPESVASYSETSPPREWLSFIMTTLVPREPYTPEELAKLYPRDLELQQVQIILRHGERTPVSARFQNVCCSSRDLVALFD